MKKSRGIAVLLLTAIVTVFFCYVAAVGIGPTGTGSAKNINTGLDLAEMVTICRTAAAAVESGKTVFTVRFRIDVTSSKVFYDFRLCDSLVYITHKVLFLTHKLVTWIKISPRSNSQVLGS